MTKIKIAVLVVITAVLITLYLYNNNKYTATSNDETPGPPFATTPTNSMPEGALSTCLGKESGAACSFIINQQEQAGICHDIMGTPTCGPGFPGEQKEPQ